MKYLFLWFLTSQYLYLDGYCLTNWAPCVFNARFHFMFHTERSSRFDQFYFLTRSKMHKMCASSLNSNSMYIFEFYCVQCKINCILSTWYFIYFTLCWYKLVNNNNHRSPNPLLVTVVCVSLIFSFIQIRTATNFMVWLSFHFKSCPRVKLLQRWGLYKNLTV